MEPYDPKKIEKKWQKEWEKNNSTHAENKSPKPKYYVLVEFPYPSGDGLHVGHVRSYAALDVIARKRRAEGYNVLYPIGWDAFGLPTENYAVKTGIHPRIVTRQNTDNFRRQLKSLGFSFDWPREINTSDPAYYKWTQWIFLQLFKQGLAYKAKSEINWCLKDKIGLANEEVLPDGTCERCGTSVEKQEKEQWMLAITKYSDRLDKDLNTVNFPESIKTQQHNWILNLHDWVFSRQRYWGEPIPLVFCKKDGWIAVPDEQLPVELPELENFKPTDTGESPLAKATEWINTTCPRCNGPAKRETDVMPNWAGSSWYFLAYAMYTSLFSGPTAKWDIGLLKYWTPVDWYNGGMEHTTLHLLYSRFWHKFLFDQKLVPTSEPYVKRTSHGPILVEGGVKMSKSKGNVVSPDDIIKRFGADSLRLYEMFMGPFEQAIVWDKNGLVGTRRFLEKVWRVSSKLQSGEVIRPLVHQTIKKVGVDIESMAFNTVVSALMILFNDFEKNAPNKIEYKITLRLLAPMAPHITEELWLEMGHTSSIHIEPWPTYEEGVLKEDKIWVVVQVDGKSRGRINISADISKQEAVAEARKVVSVSKWLTNNDCRTVYVPGKVLNFVNKGQEKQ